MVFRIHKLCFVCSDDRICQLWTVMDCLIRMSSCICFLVLIRSAVVSPVLLAQFMSLYCNSTMLCVPTHSMHGRQQLRSTTSGTLLVLHARTATGQLSFTVNGPRTWNSLPADLRTPDTTLCSFKRHLKAHLFQQ